jgi:transposase
MKKKEPAMLTAKEAAAMIGAGESSVRLWASQGRFAGARQEETPFGSYWLIPETALEGFVNPGRGRPRKKASEKKAKE